MNATQPQQTNMTPEQALQLLTELASLPFVKLNLQEHSAIQQALATLRPLVTPPAPVSQ